MDFNTGFYLIDHRLIALVMVAVLVAAGEIGFRLGSRRIIGISISRPDAISWYAEDFPGKPDRWEPWVPGDYCKVRLLGLRSGLVAAAGDAAGNLKAPSGQSSPCDGLCGPCVSDRSQ